MSVNSRCFENTLEDYGKCETEIIVDGKLSKKFIARLKDTINILLSKLETEYRGTNLNWNDISVYTGTSGVALLYLHLYKSGYKKEALQWSNLFISKAINSDGTVIKKSGKSSFLCGDSGPLAIASLHYKYLNKIKDSNNCVLNLLKLNKIALDINSPDEILFGRCGFLYALLFVNKYVTEINKEYIAEIVQHVIESGKKYVKEHLDDVKLKSPLMFEWHNKKYLGAAHGISGIVTMLLKSGLADHDVLCSVIDSLKKIQFISGNFPSSLPIGDDKLIHWCHGSPGFVFMFIEAYRKTGNQEYKQLAINCAENIWNNGLLKKGYGLCHGIAGNGYALLTIYQVTGDLMYLHRAAKFAEFCFNYGEHNCRRPDRPSSLFEGLAGTIYFLVDLLNPTNARFPAFDDV